MRECENIQQELGEIAPFLSKIKKDNSNFSVPKGYFDTLENNIMARIKAEEAVESWGKANANTIATPASSPSIWATLKMWILRPQLSLGLATVILAFIGFQIWNTPKTDAAALLSDEEAVNYITQNIDQFSETLILEVASDELAEVELTPNMDIKQEELKEYIEENWIDDMDASLLEEVL